MKTSQYFILFGALSVLVSFSSFASNKVVAKCSNGEETKVKVVQIASNPDYYRADVTVQSTGDSYPTYHFTNLKLLPKPPRTLGSPKVFQGKGFELSIQYDALKAPATLDAPSIGIEKESNLTCR